MKERITSPSAAIPYETKWRGHIDGLRAISVLAVVLYHAGVKSVAGGFVGVDVFFVISGFLISKVIYSEIADTRRFSVLGFYERRIRRIMPVFVVVTTLTIIVGGFILLPREFTQLGESAIYSSAFAANVFFYLSANYFGPDAGNQPLLHFWSLGVEEQFYITFPFVILVVMKYAPRFLGATIAGLAILSFAGAEFSMFHDPTAAFFLTPQRAWELMAGSVLALPGFPYPTKRFVLEAMGVTGLVLIIWPVFAFHAYSPFPGIKALAPVGGAALILWGCDRGKTIVGAILSGWPLKHVGLWSYSIYMIHWPLDVFARQLWPTPGVWQIAVLILLSVVLGWLSFLFVETPFRGPRAILNRSKIFGVAAASLVALVITGSFVFRNDGFPSRLPENARAILAYRNYDFTALYRQGTCFIDDHQNWSDQNTTGCLHPAPPAALLWGDSHSAHFYQALAELFKSHGVELSQASASSCVPIVGFTTPRNHACPRNVSTIMNWISRKRPKVVILSAFWTINDEVAKQIYATVERLNEAGSLVVIIGNTPSYHEAVPDILAKRMLRGDLNTFAENYEIRFMQNTDYYLGRQYADNENVIYLSAEQTLCIDKKCPLTAGEGVPIQWDKDHFTGAGAKLVVKRMFTPEIVGRRIFDRMAIRADLEK